MNKLPVPTHIEDMQKQLEEHMAQEEKWRKGQEAQWDKLVKAQERNTDAIGNLIAETKDIIQIHKDLQGVARIGSNIQRFFFWLAKWGALAGIAGTVLHWLTQYSGHK